MRPVVKALYDRHTAALRGVTGNGTWIDEGAARVSLWLALVELDSHHMAVNPATNGNLARLTEQEIRLLNFLDHIGANGEYDGDPVAALIEHVNRQSAAIGMQAGDMARMGQQIADLMAELRQLRTAQGATFLVNVVDEFDYPPTISSNGTGSYTPPASEVVSQETAPAEAAVDDEFRQRCIAEMQRLANNGTTCTQQEWNELRQDLPDYANMLAILRMSWRDLVAAAGLRGASGRRMLKERDGEITNRRLQASTTMGTLIDEAKANGAELADVGDEYANNLIAYDTHTTVREGKTPDGETVQVVATHYKLR